MTFGQDVLIALGANIPLEGETTADALRYAVAQLQAQGWDLKALSPFYSTPCFPAGAGPDYVNAAARFNCSLPVEQVLKTLHQIEAGYGRKRNERWAGRTLDLDLLAIGQTILPDVTTVQSWIDLPLDRQKHEAPDQLLVPHPRIQDRAFVLIPLCDIAPDWYHPILRSTVADLCKKLPIAAQQEVILL